MSPLVAGFTWLLLFQCAGEAVVQLAGLPVPGPVAGMALLFAALLVRGHAPSALDVAADGLAKHLSLLFDTELVFCAEKRPVDRETSEVETSEV